MKGIGIVELFKLVVVFVFAAVALGFFASIGIWAAVSFLKFFGISVDDFRVAGGLVLMTIAMGMLSGSGSPSSPPR